MDCPDCRDKDRRIADLEQKVKAAQARSAELEEKLAKNSTNSSKAPSTDPPATHRPRKKPSGRKPGGQPGHSKHERRLLPADRVVHVRPKKCDGCNARLHGTDPHPERRQIVEIPPVRPDVTDYMLHSLDCPQCGARTHAQLPEGVPVRGYGPRLTAMVSLWTGSYRLSKRLVQSALFDQYGVELSLGSVSNLEQEMSGALQAPVEEALAWIPKQPVANLDETGWYEGRLHGRARRAWLWVAVTSMVTVFMIATSRGGSVAKKLLGDNFKGLLGSDRWSGYNWMDTERRQLCWSHLLRDFKGFVDRNDEGAPFGEALLVHASKMFKWWHRVRDGTLLPRTFNKYMAPVRRGIISILHDAAACPANKTAGMAKQILKLQKALFTFVDHDGIEPTNNSAERAIRHPVMYRKTSFGTKCRAGSLFVERLLTTVATLRQQRRNVLEFITAAYQAKLSRSTPPSLLPR